MGKGLCCLVRLSPASGSEGLDAAPLRDAHAHSVVSPLRIRSDGPARDRIALTLRCPAGTSSTQGETAHGP